MSYLLKALKKAEEERSKLEVGVNDERVAQINNAASLPSWLVVTVISLLVLTVGKIMFFSDLDLIPSEQEADESRLIIAPIETEVIDQQEGSLFIQSTDNSEILTAKELADSDSQSVNTMDKTGLLSKPKSLAQLSKPVLNLIPSLSLESHMYSSVSDYSSAVINGQAYSEGDYIDSNIILKHINADGIVISVGNHLVELPKGITWVSTHHAK